ASGRTMLAPLAEGDPMTETAIPTMPTLEDMQRWTWVIGRVQQMLLEHGLEAMKIAADTPGASAFPGFGDASGIARAQADFWTDSMALWQRFMAPGGMPDLSAKDRRFAAPQWRDNPMFDLI